MLEAAKAASTSGVFARVGIRASGSRHLRKDQRESLAAGKFRSFSRKSATDISVSVLYPQGLTPPASASGCLSASLGGAFFRSRHKVGTRSLRRACSVRCRYFAFVAPIAAMGRARSERPSAARCAAGPPGRTKWCGGFRATSPTISPSRLGARPSRPVPMPMRHSCARRASCPFFPACRSAEKR